MTELDKAVDETAARLGMDPEDVAGAVAKLIDTAGTVVDTSEEVTKPIDTTVDPSEDITRPIMTSKKSGVKLTPEEIEAQIEKRRHAQLLASMNRKQRRAYISGRRAGLNEDEAIRAIRARR